MKNLFILIVLVCSSMHSFAQNVGIGTNKPLSKLHVAGDLRVDSLGKRDSGVVIHNKSGVLTSLTFTGKKSDVLRGDGTFQSLNAVAAEAPYWLTTGNSGTNPDSNFIGTTDNKPLKFRVNNSSAGEINPRNNNTALGLWAGGGLLEGFQPDSGYGNTAIGALALQINKANLNTAIGTGAEGNDDYGNRNTAVGAAALWSNRTSNNNTAIGTQSLFNNWVGNQTAIGYQSLYSNTLGKHNTSVGYQALYSNSYGDFNTSTGFKSLYFNTFGSGNVANGTEALYGNTLGSSNVAIGFRSLLANTTGVSNTATGTRALVSNTTGVNNTGYGYGALLNNVTGFKNTALGMLADVTTGNLQNATAIGYGAKVNASNKVRIGNAAVTKIEGQVPFSTPSDGRFKFYVKEDVQGLNFIMKLRPVTYQFDVSRFDETKQTNNIIQASYNEAAAIRRTGFIAQEVEKAAEQSHYNFSGINKPESEKDHYSLSYESFVVPLVKAMQEQQLIIQTQEKRISELERKVDILLQLNN